MRQEREERRFGDGEQDVCRAPARRTRHGVDEFEWMVERAWYDDPVSGVS
jgi:hypothetical protein